MRKSIFLFALLALTFFGKITFATGGPKASVYCIDSVTYLQNDDNPGNFQSEEITLHGKFIDPSGYEDLINTEDFTADVILMYGRNVFAIQYDRSQTMEKDECNYVSFSNWYKNGYKKMQEIQNVQTAPNANYGMDMLYLNNTNFSVRPHAKIKIANLNTGHSTTYDFMKEPIVKQCFILEGFVNFSKPIIQDGDRGLNVQFTFFPKIICPSFKTFLSNFPLLSEIK